MKKFEQSIKIEKNYDGDGNDNYIWDNYSLINSALSKKKIMTIFFIVYFLSKIY